MKRAWADPAVRAKMSAASKRAWADPAVRAKMSAASKRALAASYHGPTKINAVVSIPTATSYVDKFLRRKRDG